VSRYIFAKDESGNLLRNKKGDLYLVEVGADYTGAEKRAQTVTEELVYGGLRASDGADISSRKKHREYKRIRGLADTADFKGVWEKAAQERADYFKTGGDHKARREAVERAYYKVFKP
jgi:hypothetical protein